VRDKMADKVRDKSLNATRTRILEEMRNNPNITQPQLSTIIGIGRTATQNNISYLRRNGFIERVGSNKNGYWKVLQN
jgi:ATP-dependent DNA helicase RecG